MYDNNEDLLSYDVGVPGTGDSPGDLLEDAEAVSSGDVSPTVPSVSVQDDSQVALVPAAAAPDYTETLEHIDAMLVLIVFLILFDWCCRHIKNVVKMFTGRNLKP